MQPDLSSLIQQKLAMIAREEDSALIARVAESWRDVGPLPQCPWIGDLMKRVHRTCLQSVVARGMRVAQTIEETLNTVKPRYEKNLSVQLKSIVDPMFPEDLCLAPAITTRGVYERKGSQRFDDRIYQHELSLVRVAVANASREAKQKVHLAIDQYVLSIRNLSGGSGLWDWLELKPNIYGIGINLKKLFTRKKTRAGE